MKAAVIAPANTMATIPDELKAIGVKNLGKLGYEVVFGRNVDKSHYHTAGTVEERAGDLNWALSNPDIELVLPVFGGHNSNQLLGEIDYNGIVGRKRIMGFSDITSLLSAFSDSSACEAFHGPSFSVFCDPNLFDYTIDGVVNALNGTMLRYNHPEFTADDLWYLKENFGPRDIQKNGSWKTFQEGEVISKVVGGNIETLSSLAGTPYFPETNGRILILEDSTGNNPARFNQALTQLYQMGIFERISGLIVGRFPSDSKLSDENLLHYLLKGVVESKDLPVIYDVHCSHVDPMLTIPFHSVSHLKAGEVPEITINYKH